MPLLVGPAPSVVRVDRHDLDVLPGRDRPAAGPARQHPGARRAWGRWRSTRVPVRRRLPALVPGDRRARLAGAARRAPWCATCHATIRSRFFGPRSPLDDLERRFEPGWRTALRRAGAGRGRRHRGLDGRLAGGTAAGRVAVSSRLADRNPPEHSADPADLGGPLAGRARSGLVGGVGPAGRLRWPGPPPGC